MRGIKKKAIRTRRKYCTKGKNRMEQLRGWSEGIQKKNVEKDRKKLLKDGLIIPLSY